MSVQSPQPGHMIILGPKQQRSRRKAAELGEGSRRNGTCASRREASLSQAGLLVLRGIAPSQPDAPSPAAAAAVSPRGAGL